jgi:ketosteroid isomerase-like protein
LDDLAERLDHMEEAIRSLYERMGSAVDRGDRRAFAELFHPEAEFRSSTSGEVYRGHAGVDAWFDALSTTPVFRPTVVHADPVETDAWFISGRLQASIESGGIADNQMAWLVILKDELIWRYQPITDRAEAEVIAHTIRSAPS